MNPERLDQLIQRYVSDCLDEAEMAELSAHLNLEESRAARRKLRRALEADALLQEAAAGEMSASSAFRKSPLVAPIAWLGLGGIAALLAIGIWGSFPSASPVTDGSAIASIIRSEGESGPALAAGAQLKEGDTLTIDKGLVEAAFFESGVHFIASAPVSITVHSSDHVFLHHGEIKLHVPPQGVGFIVETDERTITDLGTSFVVTAQEAQSKVLVLDGKVSISDHASGIEQLMVEGELARFGLTGEMELRTTQHTDLPEITYPGAGSGLQGRLFAFAPSETTSTNPAKVDKIGPDFVPLVASGFQDTSSLSPLNEVSQLPFYGIAGAYTQLPDRSGLGDYDRQLGWMAWYSGGLTPPAPGRYRFWGYADNHLLVAVDGTPVFDGSRYDSALRTELETPRRDHPSLPCLNAPVGFAAGEWFDVGDNPVQIDILFGEIIQNATSGILLIEREGESYEEIYWGQPKWPLFLTREPTDSHREELAALRLHMEQKLMGTFSIGNDQFWTPVSQ